MSEENEKLLANIFGDIVSPKREETPAAERVEESAAEPAPAAEPEKPVDETEDESGEDEAPAGTAEGKSEAKDEGCDAKTLADAKKELGIGGAAFCDELYATCPDVFAKLKAAKKTLHGFFNFAYSYALDEYVKKNGKTNGGGYWNLAVLAEKYLDPSVKEGFTVKEPKAKSATPPAKKNSPSPAKVVEKVAKKAAKAAKKSAAESPKKKEKEEVDESAIVKQAMSVLSNFSF